MYYDRDSGPKTWRTWYKYTQHWCEYIHPHAMHTMSDRLQLYTNRTRESISHMMHTLRSSRDREGRGTLKVMSTLTRHSYRLMNQTTCGYSFRPFILFEGFHTACVTITALSNRGSEDWIHAKSLQSYRASIWAIKCTCMQVHNAYTCMHTPVYKDICSWRT